MITVSNNFQVSAVFAVKGKAPVPEHCALLASEQCFCLWLVCFLYN